MPASGSNFYLLILIIQFNDVPARGFNLNVLLSLIGVLQGNEVLILSFDLNKLITIVDRNTMAVALASFEVI